MLGRAKEIVTDSGSDRAVTALALLLGDVSLAVGDERGGLSAWFPVRSAQVADLTPVHEFQPQQGAVREILPSIREKSFLSLGEEGTACVDYLTSERRLAAVGAPAERLFSVGKARRENTVVGLNGKHELLVWQIDAPHPEVSWRTLFGKVHYEGYDQPSYTWQLTKLEDSEPKYSFVPLVFGTLKATFFAILFAAPLALFGEAYTSQFAATRIRRAIKPVVEIMAAVPSVVIGFLAALWLAPILERWLLAVFLSFVTVPALFFGAMAAWQAARHLGWRAGSRTVTSFSPSCLFCWRALAWPCCWPIPWRRPGSMGASKSGSPRQRICVTTSATRSLSPSGWVSLSSRLFSPSPTTLFPRFPTT